MNKTSELVSTRLHRCQKKNKNTGYHAFMLKLSKFKGGTWIYSTEFISTIIYSYFMIIKNWTEQIDQITASFKSEFGSLTPGQLNWKPNAKSWSIAQNIHHLIVINETYFSVIGQIRNGKYKLPWVGNFSFMVNFFGKFILNSVQPDRKRKIKTFSIWEPTHSEMDNDIVQQFVKHQLELKEVIVKCADLLLNRTVISSPANKNIVYTLEAAFDIIITHEKRHLAQAREVYILQK